MTRLLHHLLRDTAAVAPEAVVIDSTNGTATYGDVDARSDRLAARLVALGAGVGRPIALSVAKGPDALVAIFAILKSGSCYVPIDPTGPAPRAAQILADSGGTIAVGDRSSRPMLTAAVTDLADRGDLADDIQFVWMDEPSGEGGPASPSALAAPGAEDPAYILYTSGSTGTPKGVTHSHRSALAFVDHCLDVFGITAEDRVSSHAPLHFDLSILDVFVSIAAGATIVPITGHARVFPRTLAELIAKADLTVWYSVPFALVPLAQPGMLDGLSFPHLRLVLYAGEPFPVAPLRVLMGSWPRARFFNLYGPTETNVVTYVETTLADTVDTVPIGRPWPGSTVVVVDDRDEAVAEGAVGELCVLGPTTMTGYWGDPEADERGFVDLQPDPAGPAQRFYRTGDRVRRDPDGVLWFHGRADDMVKVRGHRVELGEIEAVVAQIPTLLEAAVVAVDDPARAHEPGHGVELVAFVTPRPGAAPAEPADVLAHCSTRLPDYMVPRRVELLESLPRTSTGKLDRRRLVAGWSGNASDPGPGRSPGSIQPENAENTHDR